MLVLRGQVAEAVPFLFGFAVVAVDGAFEREGFEVVHVARMRAEAPERDGAQFVSGVLRGILDDAVAGADVVEEEVAVGMDDPVAERVRHGERSAIDDHAGASSDDGADMASGAADGFK